MQPVFLRFPKHVLAIFGEVAVHALTMGDEIFLASEASVAKFAHDWWRGEGLTCCFQDARWLGVCSFDA